MTYSFSDIMSVDALPVYPGVRHEILPLGLGNVRACARSASLGALHLHVENFRSRLWFQEIQSGDKLYFGLLLPEGEPIRFMSETLEGPTLVSWDGICGTEWDYTVEPGTRNYMIEMPVSVARARGWLLPAPSHLPVSAESARAFVAYVDAEVDRVRAGATAEHIPREQRLLAEIDRLTGEALYCHTPSTRAPRSGISQQRIVRAATDYLKDHVFEGDVSVADLSAELGCPTRTLYAAFKVRLGIGPSRFQDLLRLYRLRTLLIENTPDSATVSKLIHEAGFTHLGRTAGMYRSHFGEKPSFTLRATA